MSRSAVADRTTSSLHRADDSRWSGILGKVGLASRGVVYVVIGVLTLQVAFRGTGERTDQTGALAAIAQHPAGTVLLVLLVLGFLAYAAFSALEAAAGRQDTHDQRKRTLERISSGARAVGYLAGAGTAISVLAHHRQGGSSAAPWTARVMGHTGGRFLVVVVGIGFVVGAGITLWQSTHVRDDDKIQTEKLPRWGQHVVQALSIAGGAGRAMVLTMAGALLIAAAVTFDASKARGFDGSLKALAGQPYGPVLLVVAAVGLLCFGLYSFCEARLRRT